MRGVPSLRRSRDGVLGGMSAAVEWRQEDPAASGHGIDCWIGDSFQGHTWLITMWFGDEDSGGEFPPDEFAIELCLSQPDGGWMTVTSDECTSRADVLATFEQMKATCD